MLTDKEKNILNIIINYIKENNIPPTVREICEIAELSSTSTVQRYINILENKGYILKEKGCCRSIRVKEVG
ncbi:MULTISPECIES: helix-turn-helix domain-containing protein [unclassified Clostridium]|uniref:LexA family protein n=1 Tax=unclassified Clostridium TaxID=2614128 RepID=UPI0002981418|nr:MULTISPECIES: helix-turn-helix domain-containing protein [unclassified Clostridium]EKQ57314.1 MAG: SOS response transcriptional repressor, RecA-mediated autopeptidase [Clostridium sp. Maddingley MBC34-26]